jgi:hypothetical protein
MTFPDTESASPAFEHPPKTDAEFEELDKETLRAADFVANIAGIIKDIRSKN